ncbi:HEAT repeat domain-containing protein [bacterium]|nr:HEAT repeat domain-containing protein [bacterium]
MTSPTRFLIVLAVALSFALAATPAYAKKSPPTDCAETDEDCLLKQLEGEGAPAMRAAMALGRLSSTKAIDPLIVNLESSDQYVATAALHALVTIGEPAVPALIEATAHKSAAVRKYAGHGLGRIGTERAVKALEALANDTDPDVRINAIRAFVRLKEPSGQFTLVRLLRDRHRRVRVEAIRALSTMPDKKLVAPLVDAGIADLDGQVASEAAGVLIKIGPDAIPALIEKMPNQPPYARMRLCAVLGELAAKADAPRRATVESMLAAHAKNSQESDDVRRAACVGLGIVGGEIAAGHLRDIIEKNRDDAKMSELVIVARRALERAEGSSTAAKAAAIEKAADPAP